MEQYHWIPFWPRTAAISGVVVNNLYIAELGLCGLIMAMVVGMMATFCFRYRQGSTASRAGRIEKTWHWEIGWTAATLIAFLVLFVWGASIYIWLFKAPPGDIEIYVTAKQWMWKFEHPGGQREIDTLHVPIDKTIRLVMASEDVIHSFFVPAFRIKHDVVPGTYETIWFKADKLGTYAIECAQYCGVQHATMKGDVVVMTAADYAAWLTAHGAERSLAQQGAALFRQYGCSGCHEPRSTVHAPSLVGLYGSLVHLQDGTTVRADERYVHDKILMPNSQIPAGYPSNVMPSFAGEISEENILKIIAYIQSIGSPRESQ
ncbi:MAG TPA: cytochrome c oxidase subunit II [Stellaceae bacterium]|nr:cytochrome c oxidase subunit II [Stellaceae bacterium]